jgi:hypothetical protein
MPEPDFAAVREALLRGGVAPKYVRRAVRELPEHYECLRAEAVQQGIRAAAVVDFANSRFGTYDALVGAYLERPSLKSWGARWPRAWFTFAPLLSYLASLMAFIEMTAEVLDHVARLHGPHNQVMAAATKVIVAAIPAIGMYAIPALILFGLASYAWRRRLNPFWPAVGTMIVAVLSSMTIVAANLSVPDGNGSVGFGVSLFPWGAQGVLVRVGAAVPFALAPYLIWRRQIARPDGNVISETA